jgi:FkbM family methyltransferase
MPDDRYLEEAKGFLKQRMQTGERLMAMPRLKAEFKELYAYSFSYGAEADFFDWLLIHKGMIEKFNRAFLLAAIDRFHPVFANEVFVILAKQEKPGAIASPLHLKTFLDRVHPSVALPERLPFLKKVKGFFSSDSQKLDRALERLASLTAQVRQVEKAQGKRRIPSGKAIAALSADEFVNLCRAACQTTYLGNEVLLCRVLGRYLLYADCQDVGIMPHLSMNGYWETWMTLAVARVIQPGWNCVDVGANHGYYTLLMASIVGSGGKVVALEPNPKLVNLLQRTLLVNNFQTRTTVLNDAASDRSGDILKLVIPPGLGMNASITRIAAATDDIVEVETTTIDQLTADWERVDFLKIDAEGAEELIWRGMQETIQRHPNILIVLEFNCDRYPQPREFLQSIQQAGLILRHIDFDAEIKDLTLEQCLSDRPEKDWLLFLKKQ